MPRRRVAAIAVLLAAAAAAGAAACSSSGSPAKAPAAAVTTIAPTADARPRPPGVPAGAVAVTGDITLGDPTGGAPATRQLFFSQSCSDNVLSIVTDRVVIYAELACERALPQSSVRPFLGEAVRLRVAYGPPAKLYIDSRTAGSVEFTVGRLWLKSS
ncbi:MAG TPA: hypothetical protein VEZ14_01965 [Dehalococcoidia bacterium]|nr:hypothetical protein [Dehalococcoidia bacterium]